MRDHWPAILVAVAVACAIAGLVLQLVLYGAITEPAMM